MRDSEKNLNRATALLALCACDLEDENFQDEAREIEECVKRLQALQTSINDKRWGT